MKPPLCAYCRKRIIASNSNLVRFANYEALPDGKVGHPKGLAWFCDLHVAQAKRFRLKPLGEALRLMRSNKESR